MKKLVCWIILTAIALPLLPIACKDKTKTTSEEEQPTIAIVPGEFKVEENPNPSMEIEVRGFTYTLHVGEGIVGHYDKKEQYWVCTEDEPIFETSPNDYGDKKYSFLGIRDKKEMGLVDDKGKIVILPMYTSLESGFDNNGFCQVNIDNKYGLVAKDGKVILPAIYDNLWSEDIIDGMIRVSKGELQGFVDLQGKIVIPIKYQSLEQGGDGMIWFMQEPQKWGCINYKNEVVVQPEFTNTAPFVNGKARAQKGTAQEYIIYTNGKVEESK